ncbi:MAG: hypothetical protein AAFU34_15545 [Pseudomonadota bacterium]
MIVMPRANAVVRPAASPRARVQPTSFADVARLGNEVVDTAAQYQQYERASQLQRARVAAAEQLGQARAAFDADPEFDGISDRWQVEADRIRSEISEGLSNPLAKRDFDSAFSSMAVPHGSAIATRQHRMRVDHERAQFNTSMTGFLQAAAGAPDSGSQQEILLAAADSIQDAQDAGWLSETEAVAATENLAADAHEARALRSISGDPAVFLAQADAGEYAALPPTKLERYRAQAQRVLDAGQARAEREAEQDEVAAARQLASRVNSAIKIIEGGLPYQGLASLMEQVDGTEDGVRLSSAVDAAAFKRDFTLLSPDQQAEALAEFDQSATTDDADVERRKSLVRIMEQTVKSIESDPLAHVAERGITTIEPVDWTDTNTVEKRIAQAEAVQAAYGGPLRLFTNEERDQWSADLEAAGTSQQLDSLMLIVGTMGDQAPAALAELNQADQTVHLAGRLVYETGSKKASKTLLEGRKLLQDKSGARVPRSVRAAVSARVAAAFPSETSTRLGAAINAAETHYAASGIPAGEDEELALTLFQDALRAVTGGTIDAQGNQRGGIQDVNGRMTLLPSQLSAQQVSSAMERIAAQSLQGASVTGNLPLYGDVPLVEGDGRYTRENLTLMSIGDGLYVVGVERDNGPPHYLRDDAALDGLFRLDLERFVELQADVPRPWWRF